MISDVCETSIIFRKLNDKPTQDLGEISLKLLLFTFIISCKIFSIESRCPASPKLGNLFNL